MLCLVLWARCITTPFDINGVVVEISPQVSEQPETGFVETLLAHELKETF